MLIKIDHDFHEHLTETEKKVINPELFNRQRINTVEPLP